VAKYDWIALEKEFLTGKDRSLKKFAERKGLNYKSANFCRKTKGWIQKREEYRRQKSGKIIQKIQEQQVSEEVALNRRHIEAYTKVLDLIEKALSDRDAFMALAGAKPATIKGQTVYIGGDEAHKVLKSTAVVLTRVQKGQRLALGMDLDDKNKANESSIEDAILKAWEGNNGNA
jgi:hypothetical protein